MDVRAKRQEIEGLTRTFGPAARPTLTARDELSAYLTSVGDWPQLVEVLRENLQLRSDAEGPSSPATLRTANDLGWALMKAEQPLRARSLLATAAKMATPELPEWPYLCRNLGWAHWKLNELPQARSWLGRAATDAEQRFGRLSREARGLRTFLMPLSQGLAVWPEVFALKAANYLTDLSADVEEGALGQHLAELEQLAAAHGLQSQWEALQAERASLIKQLADRKRAEQQAHEPDTLYGRWTAAVDAAQQEAWMNAGPLFERAAALADARLAPEGAAQARLQASLAYERGGDLDAAHRLAREAVVDAISPSCSAAQWATAIDHYADVTQRRGRTDFANHLRSAIPSGAKYADSRVPRHGRPGWLPLFDYDEHLEKTRLFQALDVGYYTPDSAGKAVAEAKLQSNKLVQAMAMARLSQAHYRSIKPTLPAGSPATMGEAFECARRTAALAEECQQPLAAAAYYTTAGLLADRLHQSAQAQNCFERAMWLHRDEIGEPLSTEEQLVERYDGLLDRISRLTGPLRPRKG